VMKLFQGPRAPVTTAPSSDRKPQQKAPAAETGQDPGHDEDNVQGAA